jgi:tight adherence protein B
MSPASPFVTAWSAPSSGVVPAKVVLVPAAALVMTAAAVLVVRRLATRRARRRLAGRVRDVPFARGGPRASGWVPRWFARRLAAMAIGADPAVLWRRLTLGAVTSLVVIAVLAGPVAAALVAAAGLATAAIVADLHRDRADRLVDGGLPALLDRLAAGLRAGLSLPVALRQSVPTEPGPLRDDLAAIGAALDAGVPLARCLEHWRSRRPTPGTRLVTATLALCWALGGRSRPLDGVASTLRDRLAVEREVSAVSAQARASAVVLLATPWVFLAFSALQDPDVLPFLVGHPVGVTCLGAGIALDAGGAWLMSRIIGAVT